MVRVNFCEKCGESTQLCPKCIQDWIEDAKDQLRDEFSRKLGAIYSRLNDIEEALSK